MATANPFYLLGNDDNDDPSQLIAAAAAAAAASKKPAVDSVAPPPAAAKLPTKLIPPSQAVREARANNAPARGGAARGSFGRGRGGRGISSGPNRDFGNGVNTNGPTGGYSGGGGISNDVDSGQSYDRNRPFPRERGADGESGGYGGGPRPPYRGGGRRGGYGNGEGGDESERPARRIYERRSGTGRGSEMKRDGAGCGNWGTSSDDVIAQAVEEDANTEKEATPEKQPVLKDETFDEVDKIVKEDVTNVVEVKEEEDKEMTLEEYEKVREEKRKALLASKAEERKVELDMDLKTMQQLAQKKGKEEVFIKLGSDKDASKRKDSFDKEERVKKAVSINEFLKPAEGEAYHGSGGRGRGRGLSRGGYGGGGFSNAPASPALAIGDPSEFPTLGGK